MCFPTVVTTLVYKSPPPLGKHAHGGAGIILTKSVSQKVVQLDMILQACATLIFINKWITLCYLYLEPDLESWLVDRVGNPKQLKVDDLQSLLDQLPQPFILMGDFNAKWHFRRKIIFPEGASKPLKGKDTKECYTPLSTQHHIWCYLASITLTFLFCLLIYVKF